MWEKLFVTFLSEISGANVKRTAYTDNETVMMNTGKIIQIYIFKVVENNLCFCYAI